MRTDEITLWHTMGVRDADAMATWLAAIGFVDHATYRDPDDASVVVHAEWLWRPPGADGATGPVGGGLMWGTDRPDGAVHGVGQATAYLVAPDPDEVFRRAVAAGASVERAMTEQDHGGRGGSVRDPEGNHWSFGSYQPG